MSDDRWVDSLPEPGTWDGNAMRMRAALERLAWALMFEGDRYDKATLQEIRRAAAEVRAWRKSLPEQGKRVKDRDVAANADRALLQMAIHNLVNADEDVVDGDLVGAAYCLRWTEAYLRALGHRLTDRIKP